MEGGWEWEWRGSFSCTHTHTHTHSHILHRAKNSVKHFPVRWNGKEFSFGFGKFSTVDDLLSHVILSMYITYVLHELGLVNYVLSKL